MIRVSLFPRALHAPVAALLFGAVASCGSAGGTAAVSERDCFAVELESIVEGTILGRDGFFHRILGVVASEEGRIVLLDAGNERLIALSPDGELLWQSGREGSGPGEFRNPQGVTRTGDLLAVRDFGNYRLSFWEPDGNPRSTVGLGEFPLPGYPAWAAPLSEDRIVAMIFPPMRPGDGQAPLAGAVVSAARGSQALDTLEVVTFPAFHRVAFRGRNLDLMAPLAPTPSVAIASTGRTYVSFGSPYRIEVFNPDGSRLGTLQGPAAAPSVGDEDRRAHARTLPDSALVDHLVYPDSLPIIRGLGLSAEDALLVRANWTVEGWRRWDQWSADGQYLRSFLLPAETGPVTAAGDRIFAVVEDDVGVQSVHRYRLTGTMECAGPLPGRTP